MIVLAQGQAGPMYRTRRRAVLMMSPAAARIRSQMSKAVGAARRGSAPGCPHELRGTGQHRGLPTARGERQNRENNDDDAGRPGWHG